MKAVRVMIILGTLALAGLAGTSNSQTLRGAACSLDRVASALGGPQSGGTCQP